MWKSRLSIVLITSMTANAATYSDDLPLQPYFEGRVSAMGARIARHTGEAGREFVTPVRRDVEAFVQRHGVNVGVSLIGTDSGMSMQGWPAAAS